MHIALQAGNHPAYNGFMQLKSTHYLIQDHL